MSERKEFVMPFPVVEMPKHCNHPSYKTVMVYSHKDETYVDIDGKKYEVQLTRYEKRCECGKIAKSHWFIDSPDDLYQIEKRERAIDMLEREWEG